MRAEDVAVAVKHLTEFPHVSKIIFKPASEDYWKPFCRYMLDDLFLPTEIEHILDNSSVTLDDMHIRQGSLKDRHWLVVYSNDKTDVSWILYLTLRDNRLEAQFTPETGKCYNLIRKALAFAVMFDLCDTLDLQY